LEEISLISLNCFYDWQGCFLHSLDVEEAQLSAVLTLHSEGDGLYDLSPFFSLDSRPNYKVAFTFISKA